MNLYETLWKHREIFLNIFEKFKGLRKKLHKRLQIAPNLMRSVRSFREKLGSGLEFRNDYRRNEAPCGMG